MHVRTPVCLNIYVCFVSPIHIYIHYLLLLWSQIIYRYLLNIRTYYLMEYYLPETFPSNCFLVTALKVNEVCNEGKDICGKSLSCYRCVKSVDPVCISGNHHILMLVVICWSGRRVTDHQQYKWRIWMSEKVKCNILKLIHRLTNVPGLTERVKGMRRFKFAAAILWNNCYESLVRWNKKLSLIL